MGNKNTIGEKSSILCSENISDFRQYFNLVHRKGPCTYFSFDNTQLNYNTVTFQITSSHKTSLYFAYWALPANPNIKYCSYPSPGHCENRKKKYEENKRTSSNKEMMISKEKIEVKTFRSIPSSGYTKAHVLSLKLNHLFHEQNLNFLI